MRYKLILLDLDGTLTDSSKVISEKVKKVIAEVKNKINVCIVSSRGEKEVLKYVRELGLTAYHIVEGARIIDNKGNELWFRYLSSTKAAEILNFLKSFNLEIVVYAKGKKYRKDFKKLTKITLVIPQHLTWSEVLNLKKALKKIKNIAVTVMYSSSVPDKWNVLISHEQGTKNYAIKKLQNLLGVKKDETIAVGDGHNDLEMFKQSGLKVAMGNAVSSLKKKADFIAPTVKKDGLITVFNKFVL